MSIKPTVWQQTHVEMMRQGDVFLGARQYQQAIDQYMSIFAQGAHHPDLYCNLALAHESLGQRHMSEIVYRKGLELDPQHVLMLCNFGLFLTNSARHSEAEVLLRRAVALQPDFYAACSNLAQVLSQTSRMDEAMMYYQKAAEFTPTSPTSAANVLFNMNYLPSSTPEQIYAQAQIVGRNWVAQVTPFTQWTSNLPQRPLKLKIGFLSGDFCNHPVGHFLADVLHALRDDIFEWHAFSCRDFDDNIATSLRRQMTQWHSLNALDDEQAAQLIHDTHIHILIDLSGYTHRNRMGIMARKPAPIQASWLGWFCTTGLPTIDYFISDSISSPAHMSRFFSETIYHLPHTRLCLSQPAITEEVAPSPALMNSFVTLGCVQNAIKITDSTLLLWADILNALPTAQLRLQGEQFNDAALKNIFVNRAINAGIDASRLTLLPFSNWVDYMRDYAQIDFLLDTHPYTGGTTTAEALWMGVPTLTMTGQTLISNQGASLMTAARLPDWVTTSPEDYVKQAIYWGTHIAELSQLRSNLRAHMTHSPLYDAPQFARHFEFAMEQFWLTRNRHLINQNRA